MQKLEAQVARGTKRVAPSGACGASGSGPGTTEPKPKRERHEYDAKKYIFTSAGGQQMTMAEAQFDDIKELYLAVRLGEAGRRAGNCAAYSGPRAAHLQR